MSPPPVVLLHGWGGTAASTWTGWPPALAAAGRTAWLQDLPGHGRPSPTDPAAYADLAGELDERLPAGPLDAVAFSLGGKLALALAARRPGRFRRLVIGGVGNNLFAPEPSGEALAAALLDGGSPAPALAALVRYASVPGNEPAALAAVLRRPPNPLVQEAALSDLRDVLLVNGDEDVIATPDDRLRAASPGVRSVRLGGVDHLSLTETPAFQDLAIDHLRAGQPGREETV